MTAGLCDKLRLIRAKFGFTQAEMVERLKSQRLPSSIKIYPGNISRFEQGLREPPPLVLLAYARSVGVSVEMLIDASMELPERLKTTLVQKPKPARRKRNLKNESNSSPR
jgi:transcriptional regulator with XRE-family HTH domain